MVGLNTSPTPGISRTLSASRLICGGDHLGDRLALIRCKLPNHAAGAIRESSHLESQIDSDLQELFNAYAQTTKDPILLADVEEQEELSYGVSYDDQPLHKARQHLDREVMRYEHVSVRPRGVPASFSRARRCS